MQSVLQLAQEIVDSLASRDRLEAIDALDIARIMLRKQITLRETLPRESLESRQLSV